MIIKPQYIPMKLLATQALLNHLPPGYQQRKTIEDDLAKLKAGWYGEQELAYHLSRFQDDETIRVIYDLQLNAVQQSFQMDSLLLTNGFMSIMEAKNYSGTLHFLPDG
ncbi:MAG: nuclease-related domain-containing protein [Sporolactobacillus sp.]